MTTYDIHLNNLRTIYSWIQNQPNLVSLKRENDKIICEFTHTAQEEEAFQQEVANRMFQIEINNSIYNYILPKLKEIQTDALMYITELSKTKTDVGSSFIDLYDDYGGRNFFIDLTGYKKIKYHINMNTNGSIGTNNFRIIENGNPNNVLFDVVVTSGQNVDTLPIPDPQFKSYRGRVRIQVKSTDPLDDPIYDRIILHAIR